MFEPVLKHFLVDFARGLVVETGKTAPEGLGDNLIGLYHDPEITRENCVVRCRIDRSRVPTRNPKILANLPEISEGLFRSDCRRTISLLSFLGTATGDEYRFSLSDEIGFMKIHEQLRQLYPTSDPVLIFTDILIALEHSNFWPQVNDKRFKSYTVLVNFDALLGTQESRPVYFSRFPVLP